MPAGTAESNRNNLSRARARLQERYDWLWSETIGRIKAGRVELDPVLAAREPDQRRGLTIIARPAADVRRRVTMLLDELRTLEPDQYYYAASEFHLTVLSLFTATVAPEPFLGRTRQYVAAVDSALREVAPVRIEFAGLTASPGTVMIQGFFEDETLNDMRDRLRARLQARRLAEGLDRRYRLETAHMTVARFRVPLRDSGRFADALERMRHRPFGAMSIRSLHLVKNDWYMSRHATQTLKRYRLPRAA